MTDQELTETKAIMAALRTAEAEVTRLSLELAKWQEGGVTEELLRSHDGHIRLSAGVSLVMSEHVDSMFAAATTLRGMGFNFQDGQWINTSL